MFDNIQYYLEVKAHTLLCEPSFVYIIIYLSKYSMCDIVYVKKYLLIIILILGVMKFLHEIFDE